MAKELKERTEIKKKLKKKKLNNLKKVNKKPLKNQRFFYCLICA